LSPAPEWVLWLQATPLAAAMRHWLWLYPAVEIVHIAGIVLLVGCVAGFDLRLLGLSRQLPVSVLASHLLPWSRVGFLLVLPSGLLMFSAHAADLYVSPVFRLKLTVIALALANVLLFHLRSVRGMAAWDVRVPVPASARAAGALSLGLWLVVIACGRLLAYF
jgi:Family of unknown function (DUF6644)